jgi:predicted O-linked N-acetylglucosamine transferase (SPINDLY family)
VQAAWLAYPGTTGMDAIDFRLTDSRLDPPGVEHVYAERSIRLPDSFWCYDPLTEGPPVNPLPAFAAGHLTLGCLNNPCKLTDRTLALFAGVMRALPAARLVLMASAAGNLRAALLARAARQGIAAERIAFVPFRPRAAYLQTYQQIDLGLDTLPYNGHTTSLDSYWMGVPVVTRVGETCAGRAGLSQLFNLGLTELAAENDEQFIEVAAALGQDLPRLAELRRGLRERLRRSPLMDAPKFARHIEAAYERMWSE